MDTLKYILEALRQKGQEPGIYRQKGYPARRVHGGLGDTTKSTGQDLNYIKYVRQQNAMGESPVSYEEWIQQ